jgi:rhodanese-related sulfurtransferase
VNIPVSQLKSQIEKLPFDKDQPVVVYCQSGSRSARAAAQLAKAGYEQVCNLAGGIMAWQSAGMPVEKGAPKKGKHKGKKS